MDSVYNRENFPTFVVNHGNWDIHSNAAGKCAAIPTPEAEAIGCKPSHFGDMAYVRQTIGLGPCGTEPGQWYVAADGSHNGHIVREVVDGDVITTPFTGETWGETACRITATALVAEFRRMNRVPAWVPSTGYRHRV